MRPRALHQCAACGVPKRIDQFACENGNRISVCRWCRRIAKTAATVADRARRREDAYQENIKRLLADVFPGEEWRALPDLSDYEVSSYGRVRILARRSTSRPRILGGSVGKRTKGYRSVTITGDGRQTQISVHTLVALAFLGPRPDGHEVNHIDGDKLNNRIENLEYVTHAENNRHAQRTGLNPVHCEHNPATKLSNEQVHEIRARYLAGETRGQLAAAFGMSKTGVGDIIKGKVFKALRLPVVRRPILSEAIIGVIASKNRPVHVRELPNLVAAIAVDRRKSKQIAFNHICFRLSKAGKLRRVARGSYVAA